MAESSRSSSETVLKDAQAFLPPIAKNHWHGYSTDQSLPKPKCICRTKKLARPTFSKIDASEYRDSPKVLRQKMSVLARMIQDSEQFLVYTGAGISTAAGLWDYASKAKNSIVKPADNINRLQLAPTSAHYVLAALERRGYLKQWIQLNYDGLAQKAGFPFSKLNEVNGSWFDKHNPVIGLDDEMRTEQYKRMMEWRRRADLVLSLGTSLSGHLADSVAVACAKRHMEDGTGQGLAIISLQRTPMDGMAALRVFAPIEEAMQILSDLLGLKIRTELVHNPYAPPLSSRRAA